MSTRKTKEEKERLIADYKASGLSMTKWCKANGIAVSSLAGWINVKKSDITNPKSKAKFVEVILSAELPANSTSNIIVEYKSFKITIPSDADLKLLENTLKAVVQLNV